MPVSKPDAPRRRLASPVTAGRKVSSTEIIKATKPATAAPSGEYERIMHAIYGDKFKLAITKSKKGIAKAKEDCVKKYPYANVNQFEFWPNLNSKTATVTIVDIK